MDIREQAVELVNIIECNAGEPDAIARALAPIYRQAEAAKDTCQELLWYMIKAAFNASAAHSLALDEYLAAIEQGREPSEEAVAKFAARQSQAQPGIEVVYGSSVVLTGSDEYQLFRLDFADNEQDDKSVEFRVLDRAGTPIHSFVVKAIRNK